MPNKNFMMHVSNLGSVEAVFLSREMTEVEAVRHVRISSVCIVPAKVERLYSIIELDISRRDIPPRDSASKYFLIGSPCKSKPIPVELFFNSENDAEAAAYARGKQWHIAALYRCEAITLKGQTG